MEDKNYLRIKAKNLRKNLQMSIISDKLVLLIQQNLLYKNSQNVMLFYPFGHEVDLRNLLKDDKNFYLPRVNGKNLEVCPYSLGDELKISEYGIKEPVCESVSPECLDLVIVPALMCDEHGYRLGYGGGYYDRFLSSNKSLKTIIPIPKELLIDKLPVDEHDVKSDCVISI